LWHDAIVELQSSPQQKGPPVFADCDADQEEVVHLHINSTVQLLKLLLNEIETRTDSDEIFKSLFEELKQHGLQSLAAELDKIYIQKKPLKIHIIGRQAILFCCNFAFFVGMFDYIFYLFSCLFID
jgi:hypothetical protein